MKYLIVSILTWISLPGAAGISSIGNGGGLGELQFMYYFNNADQIITICESSPTCQLSPEQSASWNKLKLRSTDLKNKVTISFVPSIPFVPTATFGSPVSNSSTESQSWVWSGNNLIVSQQWLYQKNLDQLRSDDQILIFALAIQLSHTQNLNFETTYKQTAKSLSGFSFYNQYIASASNAFRFHWITVSNSLNGTNHLKLFVLEDAKNSYALNDLIQEKFKSIKVNSLEVYNVLVADSDFQITVYGFLSGYNGTDYFNQRPFKFTANLNSQNLILRDSIQLLLFLE